MFAFQEFLDQRNHLGNMSGCARDYLRPFATERVKVFPESVDVLRSVVVDADSSFLRLGDDAIFDVRDVHHVSDFEAFELEIAAQDVGGDGRTEVADMTVVPDSGAAIVHANFAFAHGTKFFNLAGECVAKSKHELL